MFDLHSYISVQSHILKHGNNFFLNKGGAIMRKTYSVGEVAEMVGVSRRRISYAHDRGLILGVRPRKRAQLRYYFTDEEVRKIADFFDVPVPETMAV